MKISATIMENSAVSTKKLNVQLLKDPAISLLGIYPKECKSEYNKDTCTTVFIATLFTIVQDILNSPDTLQLMNGLRQHYI
jgi:hypothetical protein